jgi:hypothetical protein
MTLISILGTEEIPDPYGYSDEEIAEMEAEARRLELVDAGYFADNEQFVWRCRGCGISDDEPMPYKGHYCHSGCYAGLAPWECV